MSITATIELSQPTVTSVKLMKIFGDWVLIDGYWNDKGVWCDNVIFGRNYLTDPVSIDSITIEEITATLTLE